MYAPGNPGDTNFKLAHLLINSIAVNKVDLGISTR